MDVRPYSEDLRVRVVGFVEASHSRREAAKLFEVSVASVVRWSQRKRSSGSIAAKPMGGRHQRRSLAMQRDWDAGAHCREAGPDVARARCRAARTLRCDELRFGVASARRRRHQLQKKACTLRSKTVLTSPNGAKQWKKYQSRLDASHLVFIDETWAKTNMTRTHGWCARGKGCSPKAPYGHWRTMTFLAALRCDRSRCALHHRRPHQWLQLSCLCRADSGAHFATRAMSSSSTIFASHKKPGGGKGHSRNPALRLLFLPPYSPDLNPIEQVFAKLKTLLRKANTRSVETTWRQIGTLINRFTPAECANYLTNAGYASV